MSKSILIFHHQLSLFIKFVYVSEIEMSAPEPTQTAIRRLKRDLEKLQEVGFEIFRENWYL